MRTRLNFPALDLLGPQSTAYFTVIDRTTGRRVAVGEASLGELDYFQAPKARWTPSQVEVRDFNESEPMATVRLALLE